MTTNFFPHACLNLLERLYPINLFKLLIIGLSLMSMNPARSQINATFVGQSPTCPQGNDGSLCCTSITHTDLDVLQTEILLEIKDIPVGRYFVKMIGGIPFETVSFIKN
jgi:hypothetical protein